MECSEGDFKQRRQQTTEENVLSPVESPENCCRIFALRISQIPLERFKNVQDSLKTNGSVDSYRSSYLQAKEKKKVVYDGTNLCPDVRPRCSRPNPSSNRRTYKMDKTSAPSTANNKQYDLI